jgi:hypothetical protein
MILWLVYLLIVELACRVIRVLKITKAPSEQTNTAASATFFGHRKYFSKSGIKTAGLRNNDSRLS